MKAKDWNPALYLKYGRERLQPSIDLMSRIAVEKPGDIIDIGCGPGNSTRILSQRWPAARITGVDKSPSMIEQARRDLPNGRWELADVSTADLGETYDIVFSNAAIQWIPDHAGLLSKFAGLLARGGVLAVQVPLFGEMRLGQIIADVGVNGPWSDLTRDAAGLLTRHTRSFYYDRLSELFSSIEMWETHYVHEMDSHTSIIEMISSTGLRPYLERLKNDDAKDGFINQVMDRIADEYPIQKNGKVLFPFRRLFFIAGK